VASFVLAIVAWNSYPFEPRQLINWLFTLLLVVFCVVMIWVFAQMHRDPILSRITDKKPNELGWDFYLRVASFGAVPVLAGLLINIQQLAVFSSNSSKPGELT
jgi:cytosine/uracil/thiamine/allantoin permease